MAEKVNEIEYVALTASKNTGVGLWTSICVMFASVFGVESRNLKKKEDDISNLAMREISAKAKAARCFEIRNVHLSLAKTSMTLSVVASATGVRYKKPEFIPESKEEIKINKDYFIETKVDLPRKEVEKIEPNGRFKAGDKVRFLYTFEKGPITIKEGSIATVKSYAMDGVSVSYHSNVVTVDPRYIELAE